MSTTGIIVCLAITSQSRNLFRACTISVLGSTRPAVAGFPSSLRRSAIAGPKRLRSAKRSASVSSRQWMCWLCALAPEKHNLEVCSVLRHELESSMAGMMTGINPAWLKPFADAVIDCFQVCLADFGFPFLVDPLTNSSLCRVVLICSLSTTGSTLPEWSTAQSYQEISVQLPHDKKQTWKLTSNHKLSVRTQICTGL